MDGGDHLESARRRGRVASAILSAQLLISGAVLVVLAGVLFVDPGIFAEPTLFGVVAFFFVLTAAAALVPWDSVNRVWGMLLPFADIVGIVLLREQTPEFGTGLLVVLPILWIARTFGRLLVIGAVAGTIGVLWLLRAVRGHPFTTGDFITFVVLPVLLAFIAGAVFLAWRRGRAQATLVRQHSAMIERALVTASRQEQLMSEVLNAVDFGVIAFDRAGAVTFVNRKQREYLADFGTPPDAVVHPVVYQADGVTPYSHEDRPLTRALAGQAFDNVVVWAGEPGGRRAAHSVSCRILHDRDGAYDGGVVVLTDITKELEAVRARDALVGSVSHELRSPLTSILGYLDLAREDESLRDDTRRMLEVAYANSERLLVLVTDLLRAASDAEKELPLSFSSCDIARIARDSVEAHRVLADECEVDLDVRGADRALATADPVRMRQVLDNLVTNAIKYNLEWGAVTVTVAIAGSDVTVEVADTGQGIPAADLPHIFDRFYRTRGARGSATVGTGLGLSISRDIVRQHGGELTVSSEFGIGTTFRFTIPSERDDLPAGSAA